jgi:hypothetical protein
MVRLLEPRPLKTCRSTWARRHGEKRLERARNVRKKHGLFIGGPSGGNGRVPVCNGASIGKGQMRRHRSRAGRNDNLYLEAGAPERRGPRTGAGATGHGATLTDCGGRSNVYFG